MDDRMKYPFNGAVVRGQGTAESTCRSTAKNKSTFYIGVRVEFSSACALQFNCSGMSPAAAIENLIDDEPRSNTFGRRVSAEVSGIPQTWKFIGACGQSFLVATYASVKLTKLEFRTLDVTAPDIEPNSTANPPGVCT